MGWVRETYGFFRGLGWLHLISTRHFEATPAPMTGELCLVKAPAKEQPVSKCENQTVKMGLRAGPFYMGGKYPFTVLSNRERELGEGIGREKELEEEIRRERELREGTGRERKLEEEKGSLEKGLKRKSVGRRKWKRSRVESRKWKIKRVVRRK